MEVLIGSKAERAKELLQQNDDINCMITMSITAREHDRHLLGIGCKMIV